jgi:hypothetical protein
MLGTMTPLMAGAVGSGLGSLAQGDDLGTAIGTGFLSYFGGKALGSVFGGADAAGVQPGMEAMQVASPAEAANLAKLNPNIPISGPLGTGGAMVDSTAGLQAGMGLPDLLPPPSSTGFMSGMSAPDPTASLVGQGAMKGVMNPYALGAAGTAALPSLMTPVGVDMPAEGEGPPEAETAKYSKYTPGQGYRPGVDPEFRYFKPFAGGGIAELRYQEGGEVAEPNDKEIIGQAVDAIKGRTENAEMVLGRFLARYGEEALKDLVGRVQSGQFDEDQSVEEGMVNGVGDGMDDMIPATLEGEQDVVLSDGEFIVPADVVSGLGNGSTDAGADSLYEMMDRVRQLRTGKKEQPDQVPQGEMLPA